jgi:hypothetical protein
VTFTATVTATAPGAGIPTGTVTFKDGSTTLGTGALNGSGQATFTTASLKMGVHSITAVYGGDARFAGSTSPVLMQQIKAKVAQVIFPPGLTSQVLATPEAATPASTTSVAPPATGPWPAQGTALDGGAVDHFFASTGRGRGYALLRAAPKGAAWDDLTGEGLW